MVDVSCHSLLFPRPNERKRWSALPLFVRLSKTESLRHRWPVPTTSPPVRCSSGSNATDDEPSEMQSQRKGLPLRDPTDAALSSHESLTSTLSPGGIRCSMLQREQ